MVQFDSMLRLPANLRPHDAIVALWLTTSAILALVWLVRLVAISRFMRRRVLLSSSSHSGPPDPAPKLSVLVAARNEEANIERCILSLLDQDYPDYEVIAIDDRSQDRTLSILQELEARSHGRLRVVAVQELDDGWFGKNNAMREGVAAATGDWLLFTDADCHFTSFRALSTAICEVTAQDIDFLSIIPRFETPTIWERIIQPVCALVLILWFLPDRVNDPQKKTAYANGAFMLMNRRCYEAIGGHEAVRTELNEDIRMARLAKRAGFTLRVVDNDDLYLTRMYGTPREAWRGWSRIFYGSLRTFRRLMISLGMVTFYSLFPWISLIVAVTGWALADSGNANTWAVVAGAWLAVVLLMQLAMWRFYSMVRIGGRWSLAYLPGAMVATAMLGNALLKVLGASGTTWRGTHYKPSNQGERTAIAKRITLSAKIASGDRGLAPCQSHRNKHIDESTASVDASVTEGQHANIG
jgi:glycosyltransferase involved in cell wall biosynthesis